MTDPSQPSTEQAPAAPAADAKPSPRPKLSAESTIWATGRRKESIARVRLAPGTGVILINNRTPENYFPRETLRLAIKQPLIVSHQLGKQNVIATVEGGGMTGQAGAIRLGVARAIVKLDPAQRTNLRGAGLLTRDPRMKERKKYGQKGARKRFQWTKR